MKTESISCNCFSLCKGHKHDNIKLTVKRTFYGYTFCGYVLTSDINYLWINQGQ